MNWQRKSWVDSANEPEGGFPLQSLPYCVFASQDGPARIGVGIGDFILDLARCEQDGLLNGVPAGVRAACGKPTLNALISSDSEEHAALRERLMDLAGEDAGAAVREDVRGGLATRAEATLLKPFESANYTDFYASIHHATRVGRLFRPDNPLLPNYKWVPIGYHGRASSIVVSGTPVRRPSGQTKAGDEAVPRFGPSKKLDYELEVGLVVKGGNQLGEPIRIAEAGAQIFGVCLVNDWSARDIQPW